MSCINIYTDGSSRGNPGPGGLGVILEYKKNCKEISKGFKMTTNNRMELLAVILGLEEIKKKELEVCVFSDSRYVVDAINKGWLSNWQKKNFKKKKNPDLWKRFLKIYKEFPKVKFVWIKGHAGHPKNERCDKLAVLASETSDQLTDSYYEKIIKNPDTLF
tara:strand:- start:1022 stop:1504 length:483 start_codon:yes stop_codon:yes gene_type:complete